MLLFQNISQLIYCIGAIVLRGYSGAVQNAVSILRNMTAVGKKPTKTVEWTLVVLGVVLGLVCNNRGFVGLLPVIANLVLFVMIILFLVRQKPEKA